LGPVGVLTTLGTVTVMASGTVGAEGPLAMLGIEIVKAGTVGEVTVTTEGLGGVPLPVGIDGAGGPPLLPGVLGV